MPKLRLLLIAAAIIVCIQVLVAIGVYLGLPDWSSRGQFGDVFGSVNALFSGLAFSGIIYTILLQREELALQRKELELTRQELQRSAAAQEQSELALRAQAEASAVSARLAATNFLLEYYRAELRTLGNNAYLANDPRLRYRQDLEHREAVLISILNTFFEGLTKEANDGATV